MLSVEMRAVLDTVQRAMRDPEDELGLVIWGLDYPAGGLSSGKRSVRKFDPDLDRELARARKLRWFSPGAWEDADWDDAWEMQRLLHRRLGQYRRALTATTNRFVCALFKLYREGKVRLCDVGVRLRALEIPFRMTVSLVALVFWEERLRKSLGD